MNAMEAMEQTTDSREVVLETSRADGAVELCVWDHGPRNSCGHPADDFRSVRHHKT